MTLKERISHFETSPAMITFLFFVVSFGFHCPLFFVFEFKTTIRQALLQTHAPPKLQDSGNEYGLSPGRNAEGMYLHNFEETIISALGNVWFVLHLAHLHLHPEAIGHGILHLCNRKNKNYVSELFGMKTWIFHPKASLECSSSWNTIPPKLGHACILRRHMASSRGFQGKVSQRAPNIRAASVTGLSWCGGREEKQKRRKKQATVKRIASEKNCVETGETGKNFLWNVGYSLVTCVLRRKQSETFISVLSLPVAGGSWFLFVGDHEIPRWWSESRIAQSKKWIIQNNWAAASIHQTCVQCGQPILRSIGFYGCSQKQGHLFKHTPTKVSTQYTCNVLYVRQILHVGLKTCGYVENALTHIPTKKKGDFLELFLHQVNEHTCRITL